MNLSHKCVCLITFISYTWILLASLDSMAAPNKNPRDVGVCENGAVYRSYLTVYNEDPCPVKESHSGCVKNSDCNQNEFCKIEWQKGICAPIIPGTQILYHNKTFILSNEDFNWFSAENWCAAQGKQLVDLQDLGIDQSQLGGFYEQNTFCKGTGSKACQNVNWKEIQESFPEENKKRPGVTAWWTKERVLIRNENQRRAVAIKRGSDFTSVGSIGLDERKMEHSALCK